MSTRKARYASNVPVPQRSTSQKHPPNHQPHNSISDSEPQFESAPAPLSRTNTELNLFVLRRHYPSTQSILSLAPYAVLYTFNPTSSVWEKSGIEGTLFVCSLYPPSINPHHQRYAVTILNRRGLENFWLELAAGEEVEVSDEYIILQAQSQDAEQRVYGLWVFEEESGSTKGMRENMAGLIKECAEHAGVSNPDEGIGATSGEEPASTDLARRYSQLEEEFDKAKEELEELQTRQQAQQLQQIHQQQAQQQQTLEQQARQQAIQQQAEYHRAQAQRQQQSPQQPYNQHSLPQRPPQQPHSFQPHPRHFQPQPQPVPQPPTNSTSIPQNPPPLFQPSADTQFFLSGPRPRQQQSQPQAVPAGNDLLGQLFAKAKGEMGRGAVG